MNEEDDIDLLIEDLVAIGALIPGVEGSEKVYNINPDRMLEVFPAFYEMFMEEIDETLIKLINDGLVNVEYDENLNALFSLTEQGQAEVEKMIITDRPFDV